MALQSTKTQEAEITETQSQVYVRNMLRASFSSILYLRGIFDESHFTDRSLCGINIKALVPAGGNARTFTEWVEFGVFDALQKKYLKSITLGIYQDAQNEESLIERYQFSVEYSSSCDFAINVLQFSGEKRGGKKAGDHASKLSKSPTKDEIKDATLSLLRRLLTLTQTFGPLPARRDLVMKLSYYPEVTPLDYGPVNFQTHVADGEEGTDDRTDMERIHISTICTPFHGIGFTYAMETFSKVKLDGAEHEDDNLFGSQESRAAAYDEARRTRIVPLAFPFLDRVSCFPMKRTEDMEFAEENEISIMSTDQAYETTSEAVDESGYSQASSAMSSQPLAPTTKRTMRLAVGPFRALLASRELVTLAELGAILRRTGHDASDSLASLVAQELQRAGILGEHVRGRGYPVVK